MKDRQDVYMAIMSTLWVVGASLIAWSCVTVVSHGERLRALEVQALQEAAPPQWFLDRVDCLERKLDSLIEKQP